MFMFMFNISKIEIILRDHNVNTLNTSPMHPSWKAGQLLLNLIISLSLFSKTSVVPLSQSDPVSISQTPYLHMTHRFLDGAI